MATTSQFFLLSPLKNKPSTKSTSLTPPLKLRRERPNLSPLHVSFTEHETSQTATLSKKRAHETAIWINPKSKITNYTTTQSARVEKMCTLASSLDKDGDVASILAAQTFPISEGDAVIVLDKMSKPEKAMKALYWFLENIQIKHEIILYNVTLKVFRKSKNWVQTESLWYKILETGLKPDNITFTTIISCAKQCDVPNKAVEFYEKMADFDLNPDKLLKSSIIGSYLYSGRIEKGLELYDEIRKAKGGYHVAFVTMIKYYARNGNFDGALNVFEEMKALQISPNLVVYNVLLDAMKQANRPWQVKTIYTEMLKNNIKPDKKTYDSLIRAYSKGRYPKDALNAYKNMKENFNLDVKLYNNILSMCADMGLIDEAQQVFDEMKNLPEGSRPDSWSFSSMITAYACSEKVSEMECVFHEMLDAGFKPDIYIITSMIQCYGVSKRVDDVARVIEKFLELDIVPDDMLYNCLLNVATHNSTGNKEEFDKVVGCISNVNLKLGELVKLLTDGVLISEDLVSEKISEYLECVIESVKKPCLNCLLDICMNFKQTGKARLLLNLGIDLKIYDNLQEKHENLWVLNLKGLSIGGSKTALDAWIEDLKTALKSEGGIASLLGVNTGHGNHKYGGKRVINELVSYLGEINAPFHESPDKKGWLFSTDVAIRDWLMSDEVAV